MLQPSSKSSHSSQVPGHLQPSSNTAAPIQISMGCAVFLQTELFSLYYFAPDLYDYRQRVHSSAKVQSNEAVLELDGI